jgi:hypothetical protein
VRLLRAALLRVLTNDDSAVEDAGGVACEHPAEHFVARAAWHRVVHQRVNVDVLIGAARVKPVERASAALGLEAREHVFAHPAVAEHEEVRAKLRVGANRGVQLSDVERARCVRTVNSVVIDSCAGLEK